MVLRRFGSLLLWMTLFIGHAQTQNPASPQLLVQEGHSFGLQAIAHSPNNHLFASGGWDASVRLWDSVSGIEIQKYSTKASNAIAFSPDGSKLAAGSGDEVRIWKLETGQEEMALADPDPSPNSMVMRITFHPGGQMVAVSAADTERQNIYLWDLQAHHVLTKLSGTTIAFSTDGRMAAIGGRQSAVRIISIPGGTELLSLRSKGDVLAFTTDEKSVIIRDQDEIVLVNMDGSAGRSFSVLEAAVPKDQGNAPHAFKVSPNRRLVAVGFEDNKVGVWDLYTGVRLWKNEGFAGPVSGVPVRLVSDVSFSPDSSTLLSCTWTNTLTEWEASSGRTLKVIRRRSDRISDPSFSADGKWLAYAGESGYLKLWNLTGGLLSHSIFAPNSGIFSARGATFVFSPDSASLAVGDAYNIIRVYDVRSGSETKSLVGHSGPIGFLRFSPDSQLIVSGSGDGTVRLWNPRSGQELVTLRPGPDVRALGFSNGGTALATLSPAERRVRFWSTVDAHEIASNDQEFGRADAATLSPSGRFLATSDRESSEVRIIEVRNRKLVGTLTGASPLTIFSNDERRIGITAPNGQVKIYATEGLRPISSIVEPAAQFFCLSPTGTWLAGNGPSGATFIWRIDNPKKVLTLSSTSDSLDWVSATPEGLFDGSLVGIRVLLAWRFGPGVLDAVPVEAFINEFYTPGVLSQVLAGRAPPAPRRIEMLDRRQPSVRLTLEDAGETETASGREITIRVSGSEVAPDADHEHGSGVRDLRLFRNGSLVRVWKSALPLDSNGTFSVSARVPIVAGHNIFTAYSFNHDNIKSSDAEILLNAPDVHAVRTAYVIAIGVNVYSLSSYNLKYAVPDARSFIDLLGNSLTATGQFGKIETISLIDTEATKANILAILRLLGGKARPPALSNLPVRLRSIRAARPEDAVFFYFAGHGAASGERYFLVPHDLGILAATKGTDAFRTILKHSVSDIDLEDVLEEIDAGAITLVIDACQSGQALGSADQRFGPINSKGLANLAYEKGMYVLAASQSYQAALETAMLGHGYMTFALVSEALRTNAADGPPYDGLVTLREWLDYAVRRVPELQRSRQTPRTLAHDAPTTATVQQPRAFYRREVEAMPFVVAVVPKRAQPVPTLRQVSPIQAPPSVSLLNTDPGSLTPSASSDDTEAARIMKRVEEVYSNIKSFYFEITTDTEMIGLPSSVSGLTNSTITIAWDGKGRSRSEMRSSQMQSVQVSDGQYTWSYSQSPFGPKSDTYQKVQAIPVADAAALGAVIGIIPTSPRYWTMPLPGLTSLKILPTDIVEFAGEQIPCFLVESENTTAIGTGLTITDQQRLWIDKERYLILRVEDTAASASSGGGSVQRRTKSTLVKSLIDKSLPSSVFQFEPPPGLREQGLSEQTVRQLSPLSQGAPSFKLPDLDTAEFSSSRLQGSTAILVFWSELCGPCRLQLDSIARMGDKLKAMAVKVIGVTDASAVDASQTWAAGKYEFGTLLDPAGNVRRDYHVAASPSVIIINTIGRICGYGVGYQSEEILLADLKTCGIP